MQRETESVIYSDLAHQLRRLAEKLNDSDCGYGLNALAGWCNARSIDSESKDGQADGDWRARLDSNQRPRA